MPLCSLLFTLTLNWSCVTTTSSVIHKCQPAASTTTANGYQIRQFSLERKKSKYKLSIGSWNVTCATADAADNPCATDALICSNVSAVRLAPLSTRSPADGNLSHPSIAALPGLAAAAAVAARTLVTIGSTTRRPLTVVSDNSCLAAVLTLPVDTGTWTCTACVLLRSAGEQRGTTGSSDGDLWLEGVSVLLLVATFNATWPELSCGNRGPDDTVTPPEWDTTSYRKTRQHQISEFCQRTCSNDIIWMLANNINYWSVSTFVNFNKDSISTNLFHKQPVT